MLKEKQNQILKMQENYRKAVLPAPKSAKIELTARCNYRCKFCSLALRKEQPKKDMDWEFFKRITTEMRDLGVSEMGLFYIGESFMNPDLLVKAIEFVKKQLKVEYCFLTSNASIATPDRVKACIDAGLDSLKWSCNIYNDEQYEEMIGISKKMFARAKENIKEAWKIKQGTQCNIYASSIKYDDKQVADMQPFLDEHILPYVDLHYWLPLYSAGGVRGKQDTGYKPIPGNTGRVDDPCEPLPCWTVFQEAHIQYDGKLTACCLDATGDWVMGDLTKQSFMEAWNSPDFIKLREAHLRKDVSGTACEKCVLYN